MEHAPSNRLAIGVGDTLQIGEPSDNLLKVVRRTRGGWVVQPHGSDTTEFVADLDLVVAYHGRRLRRWACDLEGLDERVAAGRIGGLEAFWRMHDWLCQKEQAGTVEAALEAAESLGLDREKLAAEFALDAVRKAVDDDIQLGIRCDLNGAPKICINGRVVREPDPSKELLERIFKGAKTAGFEPSSTP